MTKPIVKAIDLFCGAGGLTFGLAKAGINVIAGYDIDPNGKYAYEKNNQSKFIQKDVNFVTPSELEDIFCTKKGEYSLLAGCAPCQPFSMYSNGKDLSKDKKWPLLREFSRLIEGVLPDFVTMENVPQVVNHSVYTDFFNHLENLGYHISARTIKCVEYGIPQSRIRHLLLASKVGNISIPEPNSKHLKTVRDTIESLPQIQAGSQSVNDPLHISSKLSKLNMERIIASKPGGTWRDWPERLIANCHKKSSGKSFPSVYGRMEWDQPAPTITTQCYGYGNGRFGHPSQHRGISLREAALFQTFPLNYEFHDKNEKLKIKTVGTLIGNAVPPALGELIGDSILKSLAT